MKKCSVRKLLSVILTFSVLMTFMTPFTSLKNVFAADSEPFSYAPEAFSKQQLINDGWVSTVTDSSGKITKNPATVYDQGRRNDFWWKFSDGTVQGQGDKACEDNFGKAYQSLTYTGRKLTDFNLKMSVKDGKYNCRTAFSIGLKNAGEMYLNDSSPENVITLITNPSKSSVWNDPTFTIKGAALVKGTQTCAVKQTEGIISWDITVDGNRLIIIANGDFTYEFELNDKYTGGYVSFSSANSYNIFNPPVIKELTEKQTDYFSYLTGLEGMAKDGWVASYSENPQRGVAFTDCESINRYFKNQDDGIIRNEVGFDWQGNHSYNNWKDPFQKTAAVTYAERQYKYFTLNVDYKVSSPGVPWPVVTFGQPNTTPEMFYKVTSDVSNPTGGDGAIAVYPETEGTINIAGKKVTDARKESTAFTEKNEWHTLTVIVTPGIVTVSVDGDKVVISTELSSTYTGGYISLMLGHSYSRFKNFSIKELKFEDTATYTSSMANLDFMTEDGWISAYSEDPQRGVPFKNAESLNSYFKNEMDGIIRNEVGFDWQGNHSYGNWKDPFQKMAALTYGAKQYKYFTLSIDYTVYTPGVPWPVISFGQPETTPEMFYHKANAIENPAGGDSAIGLWPELEGSLNITGANVEKKRVSSDKYTDMKQWHTLTLTVMPGEVTVSIDGGAVELTAELSSRYEGGYIALMLGHSYSRYKNISITDYTYLDAVQNSGEEEVAFDFAEGEGIKPVLLNIKPARWYEFDTINVVTQDGSEAQINEIKSGFYMIGGATLSSITVKYKKKALDYDPSYAVRYYFDWEEELGDFTALNSENALNTDFTAINAGDRWTVNNGLLKISGATVSDSNLLLIGNRKFRNFELTLEYKHGSNRGFMGGPVFGITDTSKYCTKAGGGIWTMIEADARAMARGLDVKNISDDGRWPSSFEYLIKPWIPNIENYPSQGDKNFNNYTHKLKLRVVEGKAEMWVDDTKDPLTMLIPRDYAGYVGIGVTNNSCSYDNLKIQPLNEFGKPITLEESDRLIENFSLENVEADPWDGDTSEWGDAPADYFYD